jgi:hypothetical protein
VVELEPLPPLELAEPEEPPPEKVDVEVVRSDPPFPPD